MDIKILLNKNKIERKKLGLALMCSIKDKEKKEK